MSFNSYTFIVFLAAVLALHNLPISWRAKKMNLLGASYLFYAAWNPPFVALLAVSTSVDWFVARALGGSASKRRRAWLIIISLLVNLGLLAFFKYGGFVLENFVRVMAALGVAYDPPRWSIVLPVGISFYTFQTLSYSLDIYRGEMKPWRSFLDFALFVSFFPQLVAGPIVRARDFLPQCSEPRRATSRQLAWGMTLLVMGMFMKIVLADACLARVADRAFGAPAQVGTVDAWLGTFAFSCQIFYDFAGYSTCAIGVALCLGFKLPDNFRAPFAAVGFSDFWRRWHISLSTWLRDYVYIPLGGNRLGRARTYVNIMLTMLIGGLWHGASWSFVAWGGLHGAFLVIERIVRSATGFRIAEERKILRLAMAGLTFVVVSITWVFFRSQDLAEALELLKSMLVPRSAAFDFTGNRVLVAIVGGGIVVATFVGHWLMRNMSLSVLVERLPWWLRSAAIAGMILAIALAPGDDRAFIYFQF